MSPLHHDSSPLKGEFTVSTPYWVVERHVLFPVVAQRRLPANRSDPSVIEEMLPNYNSGLKG
jgi:UTP:GlnB (protein PII) uridylyltransferase